MVWQRYYDSAASSEQKRTDLMDLGFQERGTRFRLFPQSPLLSDYKEPETVWISLTPEEIRPGPSDDRMYVADAIGKSFYQNSVLPPFLGPCNPPAIASADGHFDQLEVGTPEFEAAHMYGTLRRVLDIWETYFERKIEWSFSDTYERLELVPWLDWNNAHAGYGFIEMGYGRDDEGRKFPYNLNFDVLAHEFGHTLLYSVMGMPDDDRATTEFFAFHEASSDMVAIISLLHFDSFIERLLDESSGNLYTRNELNRIGEQSNSRQIRMASNDIKMSDVPDLNTPLNQLSNKQIHEISLPFTGVLFDLLVEIFQNNLLHNHLIDARLDDLSRGPTEMQVDDERVQLLFETYYKQNPQGFLNALKDARDYMGTLLSLSWEQLSWDLDFPQVVNAILRADKQLSFGRYRSKINEVFGWREIEFGSEKNA